MIHRRRRMATDLLRHRISLQTEVDFLTKQTVLPMQSPLKRNKNAYLFIWAAWSIASTLTKPFGNGLWPKHNIQFNVREF